VEAPMLSRLRSPVPHKGTIVMASADSERSAPIPRSAARYTWSGIMESIFTPLSMFNETNSVTVTRFGTPLVVLRKGSLSYNRSNTGK